MINVGVVSLGCSKNLVDTENMLGLLKSGGYELTNDPGDADVIIVNTCGFIQSAKEESINAILEMAQHKAGRCSTLVVTGCLSQRYRFDLRKEIPEIDIILGVHEYEKLCPLLDQRYGDNNSKVRREYERVLSTPAYTAYLRIADGCDNRCAYCAIPLIRGDYVSRPFDEVVAEARHLVAGGARELNVIAQDTTRYGMDLYGRKRLPELLGALCDTGAHWIRLLYTYSDDIDDELLDAMCASEKIVKYIDIPIQHVSDEVLRRMNRRGNRSKLEAMIKNIRSRDPRFVLRTTFLVGFPGETGEQFNALQNFMLENPFERAGVFAYSQEEDTPAFGMEKQVDKDTKRRRRNELMRTQQRLSLAFNENRVGTVAEVLVQGYDESNRMYNGRSYAEAPDIDGVIYFKSSERLEAGSFVNVKLQRAMEYDMIGEHIR